MSQSEPKQEIAADPPHLTEPAANTDHLIPHANRLLATALKYSWRSAKFLVGVAIRIPGWFVRANKHHQKRPTEKG